MKHCMFDLETWGRRPGCAIRSIGAVLFDLERGITGRQFYLNVSDESCIGAGLTRDAQTIEWWAQQSAEAQAAFNSPPPQSLRRVVEAFHQYFTGNDCSYIWCQGVAFDPPIWVTACDALNISPPWSFRHVFDTRTAYFVENFNAKDIPRTTVRHNAAGDAMHQAQCLIKALKS